MVKDNNIFLARKSNENKLSINSQTKLNKKINNDSVDISISLFIF